MTATNHTEHYGLSQYTEDDRPTYTGDYNGDMTKIDAAIYAASQAGGMTKVEHTADLTGDGTDSSPLGVADTIARTGDIPSLDGYATTESVTQAIAAAIADRLTASNIKPGNGINIETSGNQVTISYVGGGSAGGLTSVVHDTTLTGDGTSTTPLGVADGTALQSMSARAVDLNTCENNGLYHLTGVCQNTPKGNVDTNGILFVQRSGFDRFQVFATSWLGSPIRRIYFRTGNKNPVMKWADWHQVASLADIPDISAVSHDATLTGDGTSSTPLGIVNGLNFSSFNTELTWGKPLSEIKTPGLYRIVGNPQDSPDSDLPDFIKGRTQATAVLLVYKNSTAFIRIIYVEYVNTSSGGELTLRCFGKTYTPSSGSEWVDLNPGGSGGLSAVSHDATLAGDGTSTTPLGVADGTMITPSYAIYDRPVNLNDIKDCGVYDARTTAGSVNGPVEGGLIGGMLVIPGGFDKSVFQIAFSRVPAPSVFIRSFLSFGVKWTDWNKIAFMSDIPDISALESRIAALESQVAALTATAPPAATGLTAEQLDS